MAKRGPFWKLSFILCVLALFFAPEPCGSSAELDATLLLINKARSAARAGRFEEARQRLEESITFADAAGQKLEMAIAFNNMGEVYRLQGNPEAAIHYYQQALEVYKSIGHRNGVELTRRQIEETQELPDMAERPTPGKTGELQEGTAGGVREKLINEAIERVRERLEARREKANVGPSE